MKIGILGGSFDPPHIAHAIICRESKEILGLDKVWLMPCYGHTFLKKMSSVKDRYIMTKSLEEKDITVSDFEIRTKSQGYTIQTLRNLQTLHRNNTLYWIIGSDLLEGFHTWGPGWKNIFTDFHLVVFPRETFAADLEEKAKRCLRLKKIPPTVHILTNKDETLTNISSTAIRRRVKEKKTIQYLVPPRVEEYIKKKRLYLSA